MPLDNTITHTPNLHLEKLPSNYRVWTQHMNDNLTMIDAAITAFVSFNNLKGVWQNSTVYANGDTVSDSDTAVLFTSTEAHTSPVIPTTFAQDRATHPSRWAVTNAAATNRGAWLPFTSYNVNDFVFVSSTNQYCMCVVQHVSSGTFPPDIAAGKWLIIIDLSLVGSQVLPVLTPGVDANKFTGSDNVGHGYVVFDGTEAMNRLAGILPVLKGGSGVSTSTGTLNNVLSDSPAFTGNPTAPTPLASDNSLSLATTQFVKSQNYLTAAGAAGTYLPLSGGTVSGDLSIAHTGQPTLSINATDSSSARPVFQLMKQGVAALVISADGSTVGQLYYEAQGVNGFHQFFAGGQNVAVFWPAGVQLNGIPVAPTPAAGTNSTQIATTAFVKTSSGIKYLYSEALGDGVVTELKITFPTNAKHIEVEFLVFNTGFTNETVAFTLMQAGGPVSSNIYSVQRLIAQQATVTASGDGALTSFWSTFTGLINKGTLRFSLIASPTRFFGELTGICSTTTANQYQTVACALYADTSALTVTGLRISTPAVNNFAVGTYMRCYVVT